MFVCLLLTDPCMQKLCPNGNSYCISKSEPVNGFPCSCSPGFKGILCETNGKHNFNTVKLLFTSFSIACNYHLNKN